MTTHIRQKLPIRMDFECPNCDTTFWLVAEKDEDDWLILGVKEIADSFIPYRRGGLIETQSGHPRTTKPGGVKDEVDNNMF